MLGNAALVLAVAARYPAIEASLAVRRRVRYAAGGGAHVAK
jgi:hypothetical protein